MSKVIEHTVENTEIRYTKPGKLNKDKFTTIFLLSFGTFLEYFDLLLYIHLAVLLDNLFFPKSNPTTAFLFSATALSMTFILRPVGGFIIGKIGDALGRTYTIVITTLIMAGTCFTMATIGTYKQIGITATIIVIICRVLQGFSSLGEFMGATIYLCETLKSPYKYVSSSLIGMSSRVGGLIALIAAYCSLSSIFHWRVAFLIGASIAVIGSIIRTKLREASEFADHKRRLKKKAKKDAKYFKREKVTEIKEKIDKKAVLGLFFNGFCISVNLYFAYVYLSDFAKKVLKMTPEEITNHNFKVSIATIFMSFVIAYLCKKYHPLNIVKLGFYICVVGLSFTPYLLTNHFFNNKLWLLFCLQCSVYLVSINGFVNISMWIKHFPIEKRFTIMATTYGISSALSNGTIAFTLIPLTNILGYYGIWIIYTPIIAGFLWGINYLQKLEIKSGTYYKYPYEKPLFKDTAVKEEDFTYKLPKEYNKFHEECEYSTKFINEVKELSQIINPNVNIKLIEKAIIFAKKWHHGQMRRIEKIPFYTHPLEVAIKVARKYLKTDVIVASILHDTIEDSDCTVEIIEKEFNPRIAQIVDRLTKVRDVDGKQIKMTFQETIDKLNDYGDYESAFIKFFDRVHNLETIKGLKPAKQEKMAKETSNFLVGVIAYTSDKLGIDNKLQLEEELFGISHDVLKGK